MVKWKFGSNFHNSASLSFMQGATLVKVLEELLDIRLENYFAKPTFRFEFASNTKSTVCTCLFHLFLWNYTWVSTSTTHNDKRKL